MVLSSIAFSSYPNISLRHFITSPLGQDNPAMMNKFKVHGLQIAMGVPWRIDEPDGLKTFRLGLFGLDKMGDIPISKVVQWGRISHTFFTEIFRKEGHKAGITMVLARL